MAGYHTTVVQDHRWLVFYRGRPLALLNIPVMRITPCNLTTHCRHGQANLRQDDGT